MIQKYNNENPSHKLSLYNQENLKKYSILSLFTFFNFALIFSTFLIKASSQQDFSVQNSTPVLRQVNTLNRLNYFQRNSGLKLNSNFLDSYKSSFLENLNQQEPPKMAIVEISQSNNLAVDMKQKEKQEKQPIPGLDLNPSTQNSTSNIAKENPPKSPQPAQESANLKPENRSEPAPISNQHTFSIPKIGLINSILAEGSLRNIADVDQKLLYSAVLENQVTHPPCIGGHSYIYGHSEPVRSSESHFPAVNIFSNLDTLVPGDVIEMKNKDGKTCKYRVEYWDQVETSANQTLTADQLNFVFNPGGGIGLTIQTCQKGSPTIRLLLRARLIE